jgi:hypothetical protein
MRRAFRRHALWFNANFSNGCQTTILRSKHMTTRNCYYFTRTFLCKSRLTHIFNHTRYSLFHPLLLHTRTHSTMQVRKERRRGITKLFEMLNGVCSADVNIPQCHGLWYATCISETRAMIKRQWLKRLPNNYPEEQTHDNNKLLLLHTYLPV